MVRLDARGLGTSILLVMILLFSSYSALSDPQGVDFTYNHTYNYTPQEAASIVSVGGSFTTLELNITSQTLRWKAYVGNISGIITLGNTDGDSVYDWEIGRVTGEVYATRVLEPDWSSIRCGQDSLIRDEMDFLNHTARHPDALNATFNESAHKGFYVGTEVIDSSSCYSISTNVNNSEQSGTAEDLFQEVLLDDTTNLVYAMLLEDRQWGFNNQLYDFQMILPNDEFNTPGTRYYFFVEIG